MVYREHPPDLWEEERRLHAKNVELWEQNKALQGKIEEATAQLASIETQIEIARRTLQQMRVRLPVNEEYNLRQSGRRLPPRRGGFLRAVAKAALDWVAPRHSRGP
jgi:hypothetical protein